MLDIIQRRIHDSIVIKQALLGDVDLLRQVEVLARDCLHALRSDGKIIFAGNGGSFADAQHLSAEFTSRFLFDRNPMPSLTLGTNSSTISAIGNDYGYEQVFARELQGICRPSDVFIAISTSGNSLNILRAIEKAIELNIRTIAWTGNTGGKLADKCECLRVPATETARIQECQITLGHILCELVEGAYFNNVE